MASAGGLVIGVLIGAALGFGGREAVMRFKQQQTVQASEWRSKLDEIVSLEQRLSMTQDELSKVRGELETKAGEKQALEEHVADLARAEKTTREEAEAKAAELAAEKSKLSASLQDASAKLATLQTSATKAADDLDACARDRSRAADELKTVRADYEKRLNALQQQIAESAAEIERGRERLAALGSFESALEVLGKTPKTGVAYYGESAPGCVIDRRFELCDAEGKPVEGASALPASGQFARTTGFVNVLGEYPSYRLVGVEWDVPEALGALPPGCVVKIEEVNDSIWGDEAWVRFSMP